MQLKCRRSIVPALAPIPFYGQASGLYRQSVVELERIIPLCPKAGVIQLGFLLSHGRIACHRYATNLCNMQAFDCTSAKNTAQDLPFVRQRRGTCSTTSVAEDWPVHVRASQGSRWSFPDPATGSCGGRPSAPRSRPWRKKSSSSCISCSGWKSSSRRWRGASSTVAS